MPTSRSSACRSTWPRPARSGAREGPNAIRAESAKFSELPNFPYGFDPVQRGRIVDCGDVAFDTNRSDTVVPTVEGCATEILSTGTKLLSLGGDHFISYPLLRAHRSHHGEPLALLHFDAHTDTWPDDGERLDHGSMFRRAVNDGLIDPDTTHPGRYPYVERRHDGSRQRRRPVAARARPRCHLRTHRPPHRRSAVLRHVRRRLPRSRVCTGHRYPGGRRAQHRAGAHAVASVRRSPEHRRCRHRRGVTAVRRRRYHRAGGGHARARPCCRPGPRST